MVDTIESDQFIEEMTDYCKDDSELHLLTHDNWEKIFEALDQIDENMEFHPFIIERSISLYRDIPEFLGNYPHDVATCGPCTCPDYRNFIDMSKYDFIKIHLENANIFDDKPVILNDYEEKVFLGGPFYGVLNDGVFLAVIHTDKL
jgi:hypothetical protein